jgi:hypothetical protein
MLIPHPLKQLQKTQNAKKVISKKCVKFSAYSFFHQLFCFFFIGFQRSIEFCVL